jgi:hypothetical protein
MNSNKYKSVLCKHFGQTGTCSYGDKCQFAHGFQELRNTGNSNMMGIQENKVTKQPPNPSNFKIVKCKNWETLGSCKYGSVCTFAHGDTELRTKSENNLQMSENAITMDTGFMPMQGNPYLMQDPNYIYNLMLQQQMYEMQMQGGLQGGNNQLGMMNPMNQGLFPSTQGTGNDVNLNDMSNPYFMGMMQNDPNSLGGMNMGMNSIPNMNQMGMNFPMSNMTNMSNPNLNDNMNLGPNMNMNNMYMGGSL